MEKEKIERAAFELCTTEGEEEWVKDYGVSCFKDGARWRINEAWHDEKEQPEVGRWFIFKADDTNPFKKPIIKKIAYYTNRIENDKGLDWLKMVAEYKILCWAYVDDLLPDTRKEAEP